MLVNSGRFDEAEPLASEAVEAALVYRESLPERPDPANFTLQWIILPMIRTTHGVALAKLGRSREAEVPLGAAVDALRDLVKI